MALLHYQNIVNHRPDVLLDRTFYGLKPFHQFLAKSKAYLESDAAVLRLDWDTLPKHESQSKSRTGTWVQLKEPRDRPNEPDATFRAFLDEQLDAVYLVSPQSHNESERKKSNRYHFNSQNEVAVLDRDPANQRLKLEKLPEPGEQLLIRPNTYVISRQLKALAALQDRPTQATRPLLKLFETTDHAIWNDVSPQTASDWRVLTDAQRPGAMEQRKFVEIALATPDFAVLEGPPGSGKTTVITELILQLALQGKRVLLCGSTHVAVDNVLERLIGESNPHRHTVIPIRIGDNKSVSDKARRWQLNNFVETERQRLLDKLTRQQTRSPSQQHLLDSIRDRPGLVERMVLECANLVCGTTIGILQHPDIRLPKARSPEFDVLIIDEASKTTFQEFLVPALYAKRWVLVGDPKQLSPYVDDAELAVNLEAALPDSRMRQACVDVFHAQLPGRRHRTAIVAGDEALERVYRQQAAEHPNCVTSTASDEAPWAADIVIDSAEALDSAVDRLPLDATILRLSGCDCEPRLQRRLAAWQHRSEHRGEPEPNWEQELSWRLARQFEHRFSPATADENKRKAAAERLQEEIAQLMPVEKAATSKQDNPRERVDQVRRIALPSILESLRHGFERRPGDRQGSALTDGIPPAALEQRHVLLTTQHRMHPDIAAFSHQHVYEQTALVSPSQMAFDREWGYRSDSPRAVWLDVSGGFNARLNENAKEADAALAELKRFEQWAASNPKSQGEAWTVAVLTFYRGQERAIRKRLQKWADTNAMRSFARSDKLSVELCTVDRFQGHEADMVILSLANNHPTSFLESPNRLNVALTRARYRRVVIGNRQRMKQGRPSLLQQLAETECWDKSFDQQGERA